MSDDQNGKVGWGCPPIGSRFKPGTSGNPRGRPRGRREKDLYDAILGQMVTVREEGVERRVRADEAFLLQLTAKGLAGDSVMTRAALQAFEFDALHSPPQQSRVIVYSVYPEPGDLRQTIQQIGVATLLDGYRPSARLALETWVIEEALARLGDRQLAVDEQRIVLAAARMPNKVRWPAWWSVYES
ncbi:DUF5681 domain-containing protein [Sphingomonas mesophila]|uniref:DUF5681 domain-containing protein n=1 Tax=Sphingomonas mesophila TaxID=2303576 RepID=UPI003B833F12